MLFKFWLYCHTLKKIPADYAHVNKVSNKLINRCQLMSYNMMISHDIYDRFTMEHFSLRQGDRIRHLQSLLV
jgi:hypothetical protein